MLRSRILGTGSYVPRKVVTNDALAGMVETTDEWIATRTGIKNRRVATTDTTSAMAVKAGRKALRAAGVAAREIDLVVVGTVTGEMTFPSVACFVQSGLGVKKGSPAFDVSAACSGFLYALDTADRYIRTGGAKKALVIGVDRFSGLVDWTDRSTCVLFGDGAGAVVLSAEKSSHGVLSSHIHSDGRQWEMLYAPGTPARNPFEQGKPHKPYLKMQGNETFKVAVRTMGEAITEALESNNLSPADVTLLVPHQANKRILKATRDRLGLTDDKVFINLDQYGNTSAGSIPLALDEAVRAGRVKDGDIVLFVAFGGGLTWASAVVRW